MDFLIEHIFTVVSALSVLVVVAQVISLILIIVFLKDHFTNTDSKLRLWIAKHAVLLMFIVTLTAMGGSLFFSEIAGWAPCKYCWIQRILMYPQVIVLGIALWKRDSMVARYILALSLIGIAYATYHYFIQMQDIIASPTNPATPCDASGESCVKTPFLEFGYITVPLMAWSAFLLNIMGSTAMLMKKRAS